ncbi:hypothetical protein PYCCODRAFT_715720 [Trametes coccinea BRFM310]|uniref:Uncharacterized protein n=1 Tax=Trametes coccinea (strain BRFM310) TaxID=1353009 RepID=A0A1Y2IFY9_TRAC3|nr:hypothetical protein PYCCODRAFT_715720 [Trametes coccinea BRFM310]
MKWRTYGKAEPRVLKQCPSARKSTAVVSLWRPHPTTSAVADRGQRCRARILQAKQAQASVDAARRSDAIAHSSPASLRTRATLRFRLGTGHPTSGDADMDAGGRDRSPRPAGKAARCCTMGYTGRVQRTRQGGGDGGLSRADATIPVEVSLLPSHTVSQRGPLGCHQDPQMRTSTRHARLSVCPPVWRAEMLVSCVRVATRAATSGDDAERSGSLILRRAYAPRRQRRPAAGNTRLS